MRSERKERSRIVIQGKTWTVAWRDHMKGVLGYCDHDNLRIELERGHPDERTIATLIHEVLHGLDNELHLGLKHGVIALLETGLYEFLVCSGVDLRPLIYEKESV